MSFIDLGFYKEGLESSFKYIEAALVWGSLVVISLYSAFELGRDAGRREFLKGERGVRTRTGLDGEV